MAHLFARPLLALWIMVVVRIVTTVWQIAVATETMAQFTVLMTFMEAAEVSSAEVFGHVTRTEAAAKVAAAETAAASECSSRQRGTPENSGSKNNHPNRATQLSTTLADLLTPPLVANPFSTMRASLLR
jgi:hypothetical protein